MAPNRIVRQRSGFAKRESGLALMRIVRGGSIAQGSARAKKEA